MTGEYVVLRGAKALALPTKSGQYLEVVGNSKDFHQWQSFDHQKNTWFYADFSIDLKEILSTSNLQQAELLLGVLQKIQNKNVDLFTSPLFFSTFLEFNPAWGLGSSSTFINNLAQWSGQNPFDLLASSFGGSGYDIAVAKEGKPIIYQIKNNKPHWETVEFNKDFFDEIYFVYLNRKQNSRKEIKSFSHLNFDKKLIEKVSQITSEIFFANTLNDFNKLLVEHEQILSKILNRPTIKAEYFSDFEGNIKSLGAWGGDFVMVTGKDVKAYFMQKGFKTVIPFSEFILLKS